TGYVPDKDAYKANFPDIPGMPVMGSQEVIKALNDLYDKTPFYNLEVTGGEPLLYWEWVNEVLHYWRGNMQDRRVETNGEKLNKMNLDSRTEITIVVSPKLSGSGRVSDKWAEQRNALLDIYTHKILKYKFVIASKQDYEEMVIGIDQYPALRKHHSVY